MTAKWSTRTRVSCSTVLTSSGGPPNEYAALILFMPRPGIGTQESRGIDTSDAWDPSGAIVASMITSERWAPGTKSDAVADVPVVGSGERVSVPTSRNVSPAPAAGRVDGSIPANTPGTRMTSLARCSVTAKITPASNTTSTSTVPNSHIRPRRTRALRP